MSALDTEEPVRGADDEADPLLGEFKQLKKEIVAAERQRGKWRTVAKECFRFVAADQWSEEDRNILRDQNRPEVTFNRVAPIINAVCGLEVNNRQGVVYLPRQMGVVGKNEMLTSAAKFIRDECQAEDEESEAFRDMSICGEGWTETRMDFDEDPEGKIVEERIDPLEMGVNKGAFRVNYHDARMIYRIREMYPDDIRALLQLDENLLDAALDAKWLDDNVPEDGGPGNKKDYPDKTPARVRAARGRLTTVKIIQCQYWRREPINMVAMEGDEEPQQMNDEDFEKFQNRVAQLGLTPEGPPQYEHARTMKKVYYECFIGNQIVSPPRELEIGFQFKAMTAFRDSDKKCFYGMVRDMLDPQRWANKFFSQTMNIMNSNAKGGLIAETDAFLNQKKALEEWSDPTKIIWVKPGSLTKQKVKERQAQQLPTGLDNMMMFAISSIRDVTGVNLELLGQADREQAASLESQRRQSAMTVLASMFDSLRRYRKDQGKLLLHFIFMLPEGTLIRVTEQGVHQYIPLLKEGIDKGKIDTIVDQSPVSPDQKQFVWGVTAQILQMGILPPPAIIALLKYSPYPESVVQEINNAMGMGTELPPEQLAEKLKQAEGALQFMEQKLKEAQDAAKTAEDDRAVEMLQLEVDEYRAETERLKAQWDARIKAAAAIVKREEGGEGGSDAGGERSGSSVVNTGEQTLPDIAAPNMGEAPGGSEGQTAALEERVNQLTEMVTQLMQTLRPPEAGVE